MKSLLDHVLAHANLTAAWRRVWENNGGPGADNVTLEAFSRDVVQEMLALKREVLAGKYVPGLLREIELPRAGRPPRLLCVPCVRDRVLQTAAAMIVTPLLDQRFSAQSHAYRIGHSVAGAVAQVIQAREEGFVWVVDADISDYFDRVAHRGMLEKLAEQLPDTSLTPLFAQWLATPARSGLTVRQRSEGLPQGAPISPLLANLYLSAFDSAISHPQRRYVRYADDFLILCRNYDAAEEALEGADAVLRGEGLELNLGKTGITSFAIGFDFLGVHFAADGQAAIVPDAARWLLPVGHSPMPERQAGGPAASSCPEEIPGILPPLLNTVHVVERGAYIHQRGERMVVTREGKDLFEIPLEKVDQVCVSQEGAVSFGAMNAFLKRNIGFVVMHGAGDPIGWLDNRSGGNAELHREQFRRADDTKFCLLAAAAFVTGKIRNCRVVLRRYGRFNDAADTGVDGELAQYERRVISAPSLDVLRGLEGAAAKRYFQALASLLGERWRFTQRSRRPPQDPVNVLLSYGYAVLFQNVLTLAVRRGLHPHVGSLHTTSERHPALVSDLMEEFRPLVVDAVVLRLLLSERITPKHFDYDHPDYPCRLDAAGRRLFIQALEAKLGAGIKHPLSGKPTDLRRAIAAQAQHWAELVVRRIKNYRAFVLR